MAEASCIKKRLKNIADIRRFSSYVSKSVKHCGENLIEIDIWQLFDVYTLHTHSNADIMMHLFAWVSFHTVRSFTKAYNVEKLPL